MNKKKRFCCYILMGVILLITQLLFLVGVLEYSKSISVVLMLMSIINLILVVLEYGDGRTEKNNFGIYERAKLNEKI